MSWLPKQCVIVPTDFSEASVEAIRTARELVAQPCAVHVLHVLPTLDYSIEMGIYLHDHDATRLAAAKNHLVDFLNRHGFEGFSTGVRIGDPGSQVADYALEVRADLIAIPSHGYHGLSRFLLGSVAERVVRHAPCPVLILRRTPEE